MLDKFTTIIAKTIDNKLSYSITEPLQGGWFIKEEYVSIKIFLDGTIDTMSRQLKRGYDEY